MIVEIEGRRVERIQYRNQPVVTLRMIDELHERPEGTARKSFNRNKAQLVENEDYFNVPYEEWSEILVVHLKDDQKGGHRNPMIFLTEAGYLMVVKPFGDDLAWKVQRALVRNYFAAREMFRNASSGYDPEMKAFLKEAAGLLSSFREELHYFREELNHVRKERDMFRDRLFILQDHLVEKGTVHSKSDEITKTCASGKSRKIQIGNAHSDEHGKGNAHSDGYEPGNAQADKYEHEHDPLKKFAALWWKSFGTDRVGVSHLYPLAEKHGIPLNLRGGTERSRSISLGRILTAMCGQQFGDYIVTEAKKWRNVKRYALRLAPGAGSAVRGSGV